MSKFLLKLNFISGNKKKYVRKPGIFSLKSIFKHKLYTFSETANISKENGVYSFLKLFLEAAMLSVKDSYS